MPYPDDFKGTPYDNENEREREQAESLQQCYKDILTGVIGACVKNRVCPSKKDLGALVQNIREFISETACDVLDGDIEVLATTEAQDIDRVHDAIVDTFRVKPINWQSALCDVLGRALAPTNPATLAAKDEAV